MGESISINIMTEFKHSLFVLTEFFMSFNQTIIDYHVKITSKGQIEYASGKLSPGNFDKTSIEKAYRKRLVAKDYRFCNTILEFTDKNFIITTKNEY